jgi:hypothetical protein
MHMQSIPPVEAFAGTYNTPSYADPMDAVADFEAYRREWGSSELGSQAISTRMEIPRGRIRAWENGAMPDVVRGINTARNQGWLECDVDGETFAALNRLVAGVFSGGSISAELYEPSFSAPDSAVEAQLRADLEFLGAGCKLVKSNSGNVEEFRAERDTTVLGRVLVSLGAPRGPKAETVDRLPSYLDDAPVSIQKAFVRVYVANRGVHIADKNMVQIMEQRPDRYSDALASLIDSVVDVEVRRGVQSMRFDDSVFDELGLS